MFLSCAQATPRDLKLLGPLLELPVVLGLIVVACRLGNEAVLTERPLLEAGDPHLVFEDDVVYQNLNVRERGDERLRDLMISVGSPPLIAIFPPGA